MYKGLVVIIDDSDTDDLLQVTDADLDAMEEMFTTATVVDNAHMTVRNGVIYDADTGGKLEVHNYQAKVTSMYTGKSGNRFWVTADGVALNVSTMVAQLREAVKEARNVGDEE